MGMDYFSGNGTTTEYKGTKQITTVFAYESEFSAIESKFTDLMENIDRIIGYIKESNIPGFKMLILAIESILYKLNTDGLEILKTCRENLYLISENNYEVEKTLSSSGYGYS